MNWLLIIAGIVVWDPRRRPRLEGEALMALIVTAVGMIVVGVLAFCVALTYSMWTEEDYS